MIYEHIRLLELVGIESKMKELYLHSDSTSDKDINRYLDNFVAEDDLVVLLTPASASLSKLWSLKKFVELADRLALDFGAKIIIAGSPEEKVGELIKILMDNECLDLSGTNALSLPQYVSLAKRCHICIGLDSGATHIAVACSTPVVILFGPTPVGFAKPLDQKRNRIIETPYRPCDSSCSGSICNQKKPCMDYISVDTVYDAFVSILRQEYQSFSLK